MIKNIFAFSDNKHENYIYSRGMRLGGFITLLACIVIQKDFQAFSAQELAAFYLLASYISIDFAMLRTLKRQYNWKKYTLLFLVYILDVVLVGLFYKILDVSTFSVLTMHLLSLGALLLGLSVRRTLNYLMFRNLKETAR